jgi:hypothetical protein
MNGLAPRQPPLSKSPDVATARRLLTGQAINIACALGFVNEMKWKMTCVKNV